MIGLAAGAATTAAAGARRASTAFPRLVEWSRGFDLSTGGLEADEEAWLPGLAEIERIPQVAEAVRFWTPTFEFHTAAGRALTFPSLVAIVTRSEDVERARVKLLEGRQVRLDRPDEATVSFAAEGPGVHIGDRLTLVLRDFSTDPPATLDAVVRIVGIHADPGEFPSVNATSFPGLNLSPAFLNAYRPFIHDDSNQLGMAIRLRRGAADVDAFRAEALRRKIPIEFPSLNAEHHKGVEKTIRFETAALWLLAGLLALAGFAIFGQALARQAYLDADDHPTLRALGMSRSDMMAAGACRAFGIAVVAALVTVVAAILASPLTPIGIARVAEPDPGIRIDGAVLGLGALATLVIVVGVTLVATWRAVARSSAARDERPSRLVGSLSRLGFPPSAISGVRMAVEPGRGRTAVPVRSAVLSMVMGVGALVASLVFVSSLHHLVSTPRLYGFTWDVQLSGSPTLAEALHTDPRVLDVHRGGASNIEIAGARMLALVYEPGGLVHPVVAEGRVPTGSDEIALGRITMRRAGAHLGSQVRVFRARDEGEDPNTELPSKLYTVVGRVVVPGFFFEGHEPGVGAALTKEAAAAIQQVNSSEEFSYLVRFAPGVDVEDVRRGPHGAAIDPNIYFVVPQLSPADLGTIQGVSEIPVVLAALLAAMGAATMIHVLVTSVRRRRRELAMLKTLGFVRGQTRATVAWQTTTMAVIALVVGIPGGIAAGRWGWQLFAEQLAVLPEPIVPLGAIAIIAPATLVLANLIAAVPARTAARTRPALVLRSE